MDCIQIPIGDKAWVYSAGARPAEVERYGVGHWIAESEPDRLNALLLEHLASA